MTTNKVGIIPESQSDNEMATYEIFRNNANIPCIKSKNDYYKVLSINDRNSEKLERIEQDKLPFVLNLESTEPDEFKCGLEAEGIIVFCIVQQMRSIWDCDDVKDFNVSLFRYRIIQSIRELSCRYYGVNIVAEWEDGGSDAIDLPLYTIADFMRKFPQAKQQDVVNFYQGRADGFIVRKWYDEHDRLVTDKVYYCSDYYLDEPCEMIFGDLEDSLTISMKIEKTFKE